MVPLVPTWDKHVDLGLVDLLLRSFWSSLQVFVRAGVISGVFHRGVVKKQRGRVVSVEHEGVRGQRFDPHHVPFAGAADVQDGAGLQDELVLVGHDGGRRQSRGD